MYDITTPLMDTLRKSTFIDFAGWLSNLPNDACWYLVSDYCIGDKGKKNDVATFTVLSNHDKIDDIKSFIKTHAPKDLKSTRTVSRTFLNYINCSAMYHFTFVIPRKVKFMKDVITIKKMEEFLPQFRDLVLAVDAKSKFAPGYTNSVVKRIDSFLHDFKKRQFNFKLARQEFLIGAMASVVIDTLVLHKKPSHIAWVSDRDAITARYDGLIYDFAVFLFLWLHRESIDTSLPENKVLDTKFTFCTHEHSGEMFFDELIRIPDYIVGTLADFDFVNNKFSKEKYREIHDYSLTCSENHSIIQITFENDEIYTRRIKFQ